MKVLKLAVETQRWDLAAHVVIFAALRVKENGENDAKKEKRRSEGQPKRS